MTATQLVMDHDRRFNIIHETRQRVRYISIELYKMLLVDMQTEMNCKLIFKSIIEELLFLGIKTIVLDKLPGISVLSIYED